MKKSGKGTPVVDNIKNYQSIDKRWNLLGDLLVGYSGRVKAGEKVIISMKELDAWPLVLAIYTSAVKAGALVQVQFSSDELLHALMQYGSPDQVGWVPEMEMKGIEWADVYFGLRATHFPDEFSDISSDRLALLRQSMGKVSAHRNEETRWILVPIPTESMAYYAQTDLSHLSDMYFNACLYDWETCRTEWRRIADNLEKGQLLRLTAKGTDLSFSLKGMRWVVDAGEINMPGGEIFTAPVVESVNGYISFEFPGVLGGRLVRDIHLEWKDGKLIEASASSDEDFLQKIVKMDPGASRIGEFAIGLNTAINHWCNEILLDEKIGGTVHIALGRAYKEAGGTNNSALHWDIIKDTRNEGTIYLDGKKVFEAGCFLFSQSG